MRSSKFITLIFLFFLISPVIGLSIAPNGFNMISSKVREVVQQGESTAEMANVKFYSTDIITNLALTRLSGVQTCINLGDFKEFNGGFTLEKNVGRTKIQYVADTQQYVSAQITCNSYELLQDTVSSEKLNECAFESVQPEETICFVELIKNEKTKSIEQLNSEVLGKNILALLAQILVFIAPLAAIFLIYRKWKNNKKLNTWRLYGTGVLLILFAILGLLMIFMFIDLTVFNILLTFLLTGLTAILGTFLIPKIVK